MRLDSTDIAALADSIVGLPGCEDAPLARSLLLALARGRPIADAELAAAVGRDNAHVTATLARWPTVRRDDQRRVIAFSGLSLQPTAHRLEVDGGALFAWCAWDTLFLPAVLDQRAGVRSRCPITGAEVRLTVQPDGVRESAPEGLRVSFPPPGACSTADVLGSFCCHVHFLAGPGAAERWLAGHRGAVALTLDDAYELGRRASRPLLRTV